MIYNIKIVYMDDKEVIVNLLEEQWPDFLACVKKGEAYWPDSAKTGFFTDGKNVRYMQFAPHVDATQVTKIDDGLHAE